MPNCFQLTRKSAPEAGPVILQAIDREMCEHFGVPCDPKYWFRSWYNTIGFGLATGDTFETLRKRPEVDGDWDADETQEWLEMVNWLDANFTTNAWAERK